MSQSLIFGLITPFIATFLSLYYGLFVYFNLLKDFFLFRTKKTKEHPNAPKCLRDSKYGTHKYRYINKVRLHYVENGDPTKPMILFLHGFPEFWYSWRHQIVEFSKYYFTIALDLRGFGESDLLRNSGSYTIENHVKEIRAFIEFLNRKQFILICHDWGAIIGWQFVNDYSEMVQKYIMMGAPPASVYMQMLIESPDQLSKSWYVFFYLMSGLPEKLMAHNDYEFLEKINDNELGMYFTEEDLEAYKYMMSRKGASKAAINIYRDNFPYFRQPKPVSLSDNGEHGMFILGQYDRYVSHACCIILANQYKKLKIEVLPNVNHFVQQNNPLKINALIADFLGKSTNYLVEFTN